MADTTTAQGHMGAITPRMTPRNLAESTFELQWPASNIIFGQMYRSDAAVRALVRAMVLPIVEGAWAVDAANSEPKVAAWVAQQLGLTVLQDPTVTRRGRTRNRVQWATHIERAATYTLVYGHSVFELDWDLSGDLSDPTNVRLRALAERPAQTIARFDCAPNGELVGIAQYPVHGMPSMSRDPLIEIPVKRLEVYSNEREGAAWQGVPVTRAAYKNWVLKDQLLRLDAIRHQRQGVGVPWIEASENASDERLEQLADIAAQVAGGSETGGAGRGDKLSIIGVTGQTTDILASIRYHDEQITRTMLGMFMGLGTSETGSRALGESFTDTFMLGVRGFVRGLVAQANEFLIENMVDEVFGADVDVPQLVAADVGIDPMVSAQRVAELITAGVISADEELEAWIRDGLDLPAADIATRRTRTAPAPTVTAAGDHPKGPARLVRASAEDTPKGRRLRQVIDAYRPLIQDALSTLLDYSELASAFLDWAANLVWDETDLADKVTEWLGTWSETGTDLTEFADVYEQMMVDSYSAGLEDPGFDWDTWEPGDSRAADLLDTDVGDGLQTLLDDADVTIKSIDDTSMSQLSNRLAESVREGRSVDDTAATIRDLLVNPDRAEMIATTEANRAVTTASMAEYAADGVTDRYDILLSARPCELCVENADGGPYLLSDAPPNGLPPTHVNCECAVVAFVDGS